jgi:hypothetical protein
LWEVKDGVLSGLSATLPQSLMSESPVIWELVWELVLSDTLKLCAANARAAVIQVPTNGRLGIASDRLDTQPAQ